MTQTAAAYLPHQPPIVLIDELVESGEEHAIAKVTVRPQLMFVDEHGLPTWSAIELMAQTISLYSGVQSEQRGLKPKIGFLLGTRQMHLPMAYFPMGAEVIIHVTKNYMHANLGLFHCQIRCQDTEITATLNVYEPNDHEISE